MRSVALEDFQFRGGFVKDFIILELHGMMLTISMMNSINFEAWKNILNL